MGYNLWFQFNLFLIVPFIVDNGYDYVHHLQAIQGKDPGKTRGEKNVNEWIHMISTEKYVKISDIPDYVLLNIYKFWWVETTHYIFVCGFLAGFILPFWFL